MTDTPKVPGFCFGGKVSVRPLPTNGPTIPKDLTVDDLKKLVAKPSLGSELVDALREANDAHDTPKVREWPGNDLARLTEDDRILHDHLCELLSDRMSESDVCTASVGIWGALSIMRDKMNLVVFDFEAAKTKIKDLNEACERGSQFGMEFNKIAKERDSLADEITDLADHIAVQNQEILAGTKERDEALGREERAEENHHFYQREWESACERYNYAKEELTDLRERAAGLVEVIEEIANSSTWGLTCDNAYEFGKMARKALAEWESK